VAHFTAVTLWVECYRFLPQVPRERRIAFVHGLGCGLTSIGLCATIIGYELAANLSQTLTAAILLLTPLAFLFSAARNSRELADILALGLGLALYPLAALLNSGLDILVSGVVGAPSPFASTNGGKDHERFLRRLARAGAAAACGRYPQPDLADARAVARRRAR
jgi:hypothetical protein